MRLFLKKRTPEQIEFGIIYGGIALVLLGFGRVQPVLSFAPHCLFKGLIGIPCLTCGSSRAVVHLSHGNILSAFAMNPLTTLCMISLVLYFFTSLITVAFDLPRIRFLPTEREKNFIIAGAVMLLLAQWAYLIILL
jgi:hypothetical protein